MSLTFDESSNEGANHSAFGMKLSHLDDIMEVPTLPTWHGPRLGLRLKRCSDESGTNCRTAGGSLFKSGKM